MLFADIHQDGRTLYPGTGAEDETGKGEAIGTKLNIPVPPYADDSVFQSVWPQIETYLQKYEPEFILLQCGADSIEGDPITNMAFSPASHAYATTRLCALADQYCDGKFLAMGGGGYNHDNIARAWTAVVDAMVKADLYTWCTAPGSWFIPTAHGSGHRLQTAVIRLMAGHGYLN